MQSVFYNSVPENLKFLKRMYYSDIPRYLGIPFLDMETKSIKAYKCSQKKMVRVELNHRRGTGNGRYREIVQALHLELHTLFLVSLIDLTVDASCTVLSTFSLWLFLQK